MTTSTTTPIVIAGPTASGKSALALELARALHSEIVCADSRQIYARMPIATASPSVDDMNVVPHHLYGTVDPSSTTFTAQMFADRADAIVREIRARDRVPILVGGTGLYLRAWRIGLDPKGAPKDMDAMLKRRARIDAHWILVDTTLDVLEPRIRERARSMFAHGLLDEARALRTYLGDGHRLLETMGIEEALLVDGKSLALEDAIARTTLRTRQYARRQRTWFKKETWWSRLDASSTSLVHDALSLVDKRR